MAKFKKVVQDNKVQRVTNYINPEHVQLITDDGYEITVYMAYAVVRLSQEDGADLIAGLEWE